MKELFEDFIAYYKRHKGRINGAIIGLVIAILIISFGIINSILIALFVFAGYYIGKKLENDKNFIRKLFDKLFPPGRYR